MYIRRDGRRCSSTVECVVVAAAVDDAEEASCRVVGSRLAFRFKVVDLGSHRPS